MAKLFYGISSQQVLLMAKLFYGISSLELRRLVFEYAEKNGIPNEFNKSARLAGQDWLCGFLRRNKGISVRKPEATSVSRITAFNQEEVSLFFTNLSSVMDTYKLDASQIYNYDETGISTVQKPGKILGPKGIKQVGAATSWERGKNITVCCAMSASGEYVPPMFIYPRQRMAPALTRGGPPNSIYHCSSNGWITEDLFITWLQHFIATVKPSEQRPLLLIMDNHKTHTTLAAYNLCKENHIIVVTLPPHSSHRLQPLDITFFSSLKAAFYNECDSYMRSHPLEKITPYDVAAIFNNAYVRVANIEKGVNGFRTSGIYPIDPDKFQEELTVRAEVQQTLPAVEDRDDFATDNPSDVQQGRPIHSEAPVSGICFKDICQTPRSTMAAPSSRKMHSVVFTSTPTKRNLLESARVKDLKLKIQELKTKLKDVKGKKQTEIKGKSRPKLRKTFSKVLCKENKVKLKTTFPKLQKKKCRRNISFDSSSEDDISTVVINDDELDDIDPKNFKTTEGCVREACGSKDICVMCGEFGKDRELWYRCCQCSDWVHSACSAAESPENFVCDFCIKGKL